MLKALKKREINIRALGFSHDRPSVFVRSQWQKAEGVSIIYLVYRWMFAIFFLSVLLYSICESHLSAHGYTLFRWPIYLTHWGYTMCTVQALMAAGLVTEQYFKERATGFTEGHTQMPRLYKTYWLLNTIAVVIAIGITGSYFVVDYDPATHHLSALNLLVHAFNSILMIADILIVSHPFRLLHFTYTFSFIIFYFSFTVVYYLAGGTGRYGQPYIYPALDWRNLKKTLPIAILGASSVLLSHFSIWLVVLVRRKLAKAEDEEGSEGVKVPGSAANKVQPINDTGEFSNKNINLV